MFDLAKSIPQQGIIKYNLLTSDEVDFSFQKYNCSFLLKFAGDPYVLTCNLLIKFKDGKVKYEYSDFTGKYYDLIYMNKTISDEIKEIVKTNAANNRKERDAKYKESEEKDLSNVE